MSPLRIGVLISGSGSNLQALIDAIHKQEIHGEIVVVLSNKKEAYGLQRAKNHQISAEYVDSRVYQGDHYHERIMTILQEKQVDLVVLAGYLKMIHPDMIAAYPNGIINIHPSLIPSFCGKGYYGMKVHEEAIAYGVKVSGATVHFVDEKPDHGPVILQETVPVLWEDTPESLQEKVLKIEHQLLPQAVALFSQKRIEVVGRRVKIKEGS